MFCCWQQLKGLFRIICLEAGFQICKNKFVKNLKGQVFSQSIKNQLISRGNWKVRKEVWAGRLLACAGCLLSTKQSAVDTHANDAPISQVQKLRLEAKGLIWDHRVRSGTKLWTQIVQILKTTFCSFQQFTSDVAHCYWNRTDGNFSRYTHTPKCPKKKKIRYRRILG